MHFDQRFQDEGIYNDVPITHDALVQTDVVDEIFGSPEVEFEKVFKDVKNLISIGCIKILKKGNKNDAHLYQILNMTEELPQREQQKKEIKEIKC